MEKTARDDLLDRVGGLAEGNFSPGDIRSARVIASRKNNETRRRLPLLADQIPEITPETVLARKHQYAAQNRQRFIEHEDQERLEIQAFMVEIMEIVGPDEFERYRVEIEAAPGSPENKWRILLTQLKSRLLPLSDESLAVLRLLLRKSLPVSHQQIHAEIGEKVGNTRDVASVLWHLHGMRYVALVGELPIQINLGNYIHHGTTATWSITKSGIDIIDRLPEPTT